MEADYLLPFAAGEMGLSEVAQRYVKEGHYSSLEHARAGLRWSIADSPYQQRMQKYSRTIDRELSNCPNPYELSDPKAAREVRTRIDSACLALKELEQEGVFNDDGRRGERVILIEAGDRTDDFVLGYAKKLNPPAVFERFRKLFESPAWGAYSELGTKKVYTTLSIDMTADRRWLAAATEYVRHASAPTDVAHLGQSRPRPRRVAGCCYDVRCVFVDGSRG